MQCVPGTHKVDRTLRCKINFWWQKFCLGPLIQKRRGPWDSSWKFLLKTLCTEHSLGCSVCYSKEIWIVRAFWLVNKSVFISLWTTKMSNVVGNLQVVRMYSFMKEIKVYIRASYIVFLFAKTQNNNFIKEIKHFLCAFVARRNSWQSLWEFSSRWKPQLRLGFFLICSQNLPTVHLDFHQTMNARRTCFWFK